MKQTQPRKAAQARAKEPAPAARQASARLLTRAEMAAKMHCTDTHLYVLVRRNVLPPPVIPGRWYQPDVDAAIRKLAEAARRKHAERMAKGERATP
jgi:predicted DNA-binding transcriptional regulator AlpA